MGCGSGFLQVEDGKDVGGEVREDGYGGRGVHVHSAKSRAAKGHFFGDLRGRNSTRLAIEGHYSGDMTRRRGLVPCDCASLGLVADGLVVGRWTDA